MSINAKYADLGDDELLNEFACESWAEDRCCSKSELQESHRALEALRSEILKRMKNAKVSPSKTGAGAQA